MDIRKVNVLMQHKYGLAITVSLSLLAIYKAGSALGEFLFYITH